MSTTKIATSLFVLLSACTPSPAAAPTPSQAADPGAKSPAPPAPAPDAPNEDTKAPPAEAPPTDEPKTPAAEVPGDFVFHDVVRRPTNDISAGAPGLRLFRTTDGSLFVTAGPQVMRVGDDGTLSRDRTWLAGLTPIADPSMETIEDMYYAWDAVFLGGRWPDATFLATTYEAGFRGPADPVAVHRWRNDKWQPVDTKTKRFAWHVIGSGPWLEDKVLGLRAYQPEHHFYFTEDETDGPPDAMVKRGEAAVAKAKRLVVLRGTGQAPAAMANRKISAFASLPSGEILAVEGGSASAVVHYDPATDEARSLPLPRENQRRVDGLHVVSPTAAWAWGKTDDEPQRPYLAHFDGTAWSKHEVPDAKDGVTSFDVTPSGALWATLGGSEEAFEAKSASVWTKPAGKPWRQIELPQGARVAKLMARTDQDIWLVGDSVRRSGKAGPVVEIPVLDALWKDAVMYADPITFPSECPFPVVMLTSEADGDYAAEKAALAAEFTAAAKGSTIRLAEVEFRQQTRLAVLLEFDTDDSWVDGKLRKALSDQYGAAHCIMLEPKTEIASYRGTR